jgi:hypothetical protein
MPPPNATLRPLPSHQTGLPRLLGLPFRRAVPTTPADRTGARAIASLSMLPSPVGRRVGIRIVTFEACVGFTHVTARRIAQPPKATFVTRLQPDQLPGQAARQLLDQSTTLRVESSSTDNPRLRGALPIPDLALIPDDSRPGTRAGFVATSPEIRYQSGSGGDKRLLGAHAHRSSDLLSAI